MNIRIQSNANNNMTTVSFEMPMQALVHATTSIESLKRMSEEIVEKIIEKYLKENSEKIISKINTKELVNSIKARMATKIALEVMDKKYKTGRSQP